MGIYAAMRLTSIEFSFDPCNIYRIRYLIIRQQLQYKQITIHYDHAAADNGDADDACCFSGGVS